MIEALPAPPRPDTLASRWLKKLPGGAFAQEQLDKLETRVLTELKTRMERVQEDNPAEMSVLAIAIRGDAEPRHTPHAAGNLLSKLLHRAEHEEEAEARSALYSSILRQLTPCEARLLAALSDGSRYPTLDATSQTLLGSGRELVLELLSPIGKKAGIQCLELTPVYLARLRNFGLLSFTDEDDDANLQYQLLEASTEIRRSAEIAQKQGKRLRFNRRSVQLSELGQALWKACRISEDKH